MPPKESRKRASQVEGQTTLGNFIISKKFKENETPLTEQITEENKDTNEVKSTEVILNDGFPTYEDWLKDLGDWQEPLNTFLSRGVLQKIHKAVRTEYKTNTIYPPPNLIFNAFKMVSFANIKVVIVGQDPYIKKDQAMGLSFSVPKGTSVPPSLKNVFAALENDKEVSFKNPKPIHGDLTKWAKQGVLLLNSVLTVREGASNSHKELEWDKFTDEVIRTIGAKKSGVVFMLWGKFAQAKAKFINRDKHKVLEYAHPSPLASGVDFAKCPHFSQANKYLKKQGCDPIDWNID